MASSSASSAAARPPIVYPMLGVAVLSFSMSPILVRFADEGPALAIAVWRTLFAVFMLAPFALVRIQDEVQRFTPRDVGLIGGAGVLLGLHFVAWIESLYYTSVASASVLVATSPIYLAVLGYLFLRERLSWQVVAAIVLAVLGVGLIGWGDASPMAVGSHPLLGNGLALTAALVFSIYLLIGRVIRRKTSWLAYVFPLYSVSAMTIALIAWMLETPLLGYSPLFYVLCALMALGPQVIGHGTFNYAVRYFPAALLGLISLFEPVGASALAFVLFGERPRGIAILGMVVVLVSVSFAVWYERRRSPQRSS